MTAKTEDGRALRRVATTNKLVQAHAELLREGELAPTAAQISQRAGVSLRTLWTVFSDMEALLQESTTSWAEGDRALHSSIDPNLPIAERIRLFCDERQRRLEYIAPAARAMNMRLHNSRVLQESRKSATADLCAFVEETFAPELQTARQVQDARALRDRIVTATSWDTWSFYTADLGYSPEDAREQFARTLQNEFAAELAG